MVEPCIKVFVEGEFGNLYVFKVLGGSVPVNVIPVWSGVRGDGEGKKNSCVGG